FGDVYLPRARPRLEHQESVGPPLPLVRGIRTPHGTGSHRPGRPHVADQLLAALVHTNLRALRIPGLGVDLQHLLHRRPEAGRGLGRQAPRLLQPRLDLVFLSVRQTVAGSIASTTAHATSWSASSVIVQRAWPAGGGLQATAANGASWAPSRLRARR